MLTVEVCNDYSLWPHSGLSMSSLSGAPLLSSRGFMVFYPCSYLQPQQSHVTYMSSNRNHNGPHLPAHIQPRSLPHYAKNVNENVEHTWNLCGASQSSKRNWRGAKRSSKNATTVRRLSISPSWIHPYRNSRAIALSACYNSPRHGMRH